MKAITCSQCGALIKEISAKKKFTDCRYCGAVIPILLEKIFEVPDKSDASTTTAAKAKPAESDKQGKVIIYKGVDFNEDNLMLADNSGGKTKGAFVLIFIGLLFLFATVLNLILSGKTKKSEAAAKSPDYKTYSTPADFQTPEFDVEMPTPFPDITYRAYVKHFTDIGVEHVEIPTIEREQLPTLDIKELKKTVFKEKRIKVRITINTEGEVIEAKALNGHQALQEISLIAAKKSLFATRRKNHTTVLTYIYVLEE